MAPTHEILRTARAALFGNAALWLPAFLTIILQDMVLPLAARGGHPGQALAGLMAAIGAVMIGAGWLAMIDAVLEDRPPGLQAFADGVNARWVPIVVGNLVFWMLVLALAGLAAGYGAATYGWDALLAWGKPLLDLPPDKQQAALDPATMPPAVLGWMNLVAGWFAAFLALNALLVFWQPLVVLRGHGWLSAWATSAGLFVRRFWQVLTLGALHLTGLFAARALMATMEPVTTFLGVGLYVGVVALFTIAYAAVVADAFPRTPPAPPRVDVVA